MKIACVSISRSDWNALGMVAMALRHEGADVEAWVHDYHEAPEMLEGDGFLARPLDYCRPDIAVLCGDRFETLKVAAHLAWNRIPIAHLAGGDITEGSSDDGYRHAITKLAHLHFPTHTDAARRLLQMGEEAWRVTCFGSASLDRIRVTPLLTLEDTLRAVGVRDTDPVLNNPLILVNWQPDTLGDNEAGVRALITALSRFGGNAIIVGPNDDPGGDVATQALREWAFGFDDMARFVTNLPSQVYLSLMKHCHVMVGNSSSAYYEASALGCRAINVGDRQKGRPLTNNIILARAEAGDITRALRFALDTAKGADTGGPFGSGNAAPAIARVILAQAGDRARLLRKRFVDHEC